MKILGRGQNGAPRARPSGSTTGNPGVLFPGPEGWEWWGGSLQSPVCTGPVDQPQKLKPAPGCVMSLPAGAFFSLPIWVPVVEDSPAREQTQIKLEMKGMLGANPDGAIWSFEAIRRESLPATEEGEAAARQLEATAVLAAPFREEWLVENAARYEPAGRLLAAPGPGSVGLLRRELGRWVADLYQGGKWLHSQPLLSPGLDVAAAVELTTTLAQLEGEGILGPLDGWYLQDSAGLSVPEFTQHLAAPVRMAERIPPRPGGEAWNLPPPALTELRTERTKTAQRKKVARTGLMAYLTAIFVLVAFLAWPLVRLQLAQAELRKIGPEAQTIRLAAAVWREAGAWLEPRRNAVELLWQVSRPLIEADPPAVEGVRLTLFDLNPRRLLLQGEGKDLERVEKYFQWLKNDPALEGFTWKHPQPRLLPNGNAQFQAEGVPPGVTVEAEEGGQNENPDGA